MTEMDIEDVYTLMDVQLRDRPDSRELYKRWERQNWSAFDIDFTKDKDDWTMLPDALKEEVRVQRQGNGCRLQDGRVRNGSGRALRELHAGAGIDFAAYHCAGFVSGVFDGGDSAP